MIIREAKPEDFLEIATIFKENGGEFYPHENQKVVVVTTDKEIIGLVAVEVIINVGPTWVSPAYRGDLRKGREGVCAKMWQYLLDNVFTQGIRNAGCYTFPRHYLSAHVAKTMGFEKMPWEVWRKRF